MTRRGRTVLLGALALLVIAALLLLGLFPQGFLRGYVETRLQQGLGPGSSVKNMRVVPWRLRAEVHDLVIEGPTYRLIVPRARIILAPGFLMGRDLSFRLVEMEGPRLEVTPSDEKTPYKPLDQPLLIERLSVVRGTIVYHLAPDQQLTLEGVALTGSIGQGTLDAAATRGVWQADRTITFGPAGGKLRISSQLDIHLIGFDAAMGDSRLHASGPVGRIGALNPDLDFTGSVDLGDLRQFDLGPKMSGKVRMEGEVKGLADSFRAQAEVEGSHLVIADWPIDRLDAHVEQQGLTGGRTDLKFDARLLGGQAKGDATLRGGDTTARVNFAGLRVEALRRQGIDLPWPETGPLSGEVTARGDWNRSLDVKGHATAEGPGPAGFALHAKLDASGSVRPAARTVDLGFTLDLDASRAPTGDLPRVRSADLVAKGRARGAMPPAVEGRFDGALRVETATGVEPVPVRGTFRAARGSYAVTADAEGLGGTVTARAEGSGRIVRRLEVHGEAVELGLIRPEADAFADFDLTASGPWDRLSGSGRVFIHELLWNDVWVGDVTAQLEGTQGRGRVSFQAPEMAATGDGTFDSKTVQLTVRLDQTPIERLAAFAPPGRPVRGQTTGTVELTIPIADPQAAVALARLETLEVVSGDLDIRATAPVIATYRDRTIEIQQLQAEGEGATATVSGRFGLDPESRFDADVRFDVDLARLPHPPDLTVTGAAQGNVSLTGTRSRPRAFGEVTIQGVTVQHPRVAEVLRLEDGRLHLQGHQAVLENVRGNVAGGSIELSGTVPMAALLPPAGAERFGFEAGVEADLVLRWQGVQAATLVEALRPGPSRVQATLDGEARVAGTVGTWRDAHGELRLTATGVRVQDLDLEVQPIVARLEAGRVTTDGLVVGTHGTTFRVDGSADLRNKTFEAQGKGQLELRTLSPWLEEASLTGIGDVDVRAEGPFASPRAEGTIQVKDGTLRARDIRQPITAINMLVTVDDRTIRITNGTAQLGGGTLTMDGSARLAGLTVDDVRIALKGTEIGLRYPVGGGQSRVRQLLEELKARVNADLTLTGKPGDFLLAGTLSVERSLYDTDIFLEDALLAPTTVAAERQPSRLFQSIGLNVNVVTTNPFIVRNNLAQVEAEGALLLRGDMDVPAPYGRFDMVPGGKVFLQSQEFVVESGSLVYSGTMDPDITVRATSLVKTSPEDIEVTIVAQGVLPAVTLKLSSNPPLTEQEIGSLIATGRADAFTSPSAWIAGEQAATLFAGRFTRAVSRQLMDLGFDQVSIQPDLIAREGNPSARFTFGKQIGPNFRLIYSHSLANAEEQFYEAQYRLRLGQEITFKLQRRFDGGYTFGAGQRISFGGPPRRREPSRAFDPTTLKDVRLDGPLRDFPDLLQAAHAKRGKKVTYWDLLDDADRLHERLVSQGYLEAVVDARLEGDVAVFSGVAGRKHHWRVEGMTSPPDIDPVMRGALFEEEGIDRAREVLLTELRRRGHLKANVEVKTVMEGEFHTMVFAADPGPVLTAQVSFPGAVVLSHAELLDAAGGAPNLITKPADAEEAILARYREARHLVAKVGPTRVAEEPGVVRIEVPIEEGPEATVAAVRFSGATVPEAELIAAADLPTGGPYDPTAANQSTVRLRDLYLTRGYAAVRVTPRVEPRGADLDVVFAVHEGQRQTIGPVEIKGLRRTSASMVKKQVDLEPGSPLDPRKLAAVERRLREIGVFRRAVVTASADPEARITIELEEDAPFSVAYDVRYSDVDQFGGSVDGQVKNLFGRGVSLGLRLKGGRWVQEGRTSLHFPSVGKISDVTTSVFYLRHTIRTAYGEALLPPPLPTDVGTREEQGFEIQHSVHRFRPWEILYGYQYRRLICPGQGFPALSNIDRGPRIVDPCDRTVLERTTPLQDTPISLDLGALNATLVRDDRDNILNPRRGAFLSLNLQGAPSFAGSDFDYVRQYFQAAYHRPLGDTLVWSQRFSIGTIHTFGNRRLPVSALFNGGGSLTVRGYEVDSLGRRTRAGEALGGEATLVFNEELRYQHTATGLGAAVFYDAGNVWARIRALDLGLRHSAGFGVRYESGFGLLRVDIAFPITPRRRPKDSRYQIWFGFGQLF